MYDIDLVSEFNLDQTCFGMCVNNKKKIRPWSPIKHWIIVKEYNKTRLSRTLVIRNSTQFELSFGPHKLYHQSMFIPRLLVNLSPMGHHGHLVHVTHPSKNIWKKAQQYGPFYRKMEKYWHFCVKLGKCGPFLITKNWTILLTNAKYFGPFFSCARAKCGPF